jgi:uncharacterized protein YprB with RNaseH-like and TPR domain
MISNLKSKLKAMSSSSHSAKKSEISPDKPAFSAESTFTESSSSAEESTSVVDPVNNLDRGSFGGDIIQSDDGEFVRKRTVYGFDEFYGRILLSGLLTGSFADSQWWTRLDEDLRMEDIVFLDTETTGLAGGTGTVAFLIGLGYIEENGLVVDQFLMRDFDEEYPMLQAIMDLLRRFKVLVTFNGKSFDWPLLETRLIYSRLRPISWEDSHLDLLHVARRLWSNRLENCSLISLEENILHKHRLDDIPGSQIPNIYLDYLHTRDTSEMKRVVQHNEWDIAAMAALLVHIAELYNDPHNKGDSYELFGIARELERNHRIREAAACYKACIGTAAHHSLKLDAKKRFAYLTKRHKGPQKAMTLWAELAGEEGSLYVFPLIEMAKCLEHKEKDYQRALECTNKAIKLVNKAQSTGGQKLKEELLKRRQRLLRKIERIEKIEKIERSMERWG